MSGKEIEEFMGRRRLTQQQLADALGVTLGAVRHWVCGRREPNETVARLIRLFDTNMEYMEYFESLASDA